ncbi:MAG: hypothetical protein HY002_00215 [Candidatus Rokubacteria bacterium]|nr:hypothetical protein [Candidatus Rokubacteria bacterium]
MAKSLYDSRLSHQALPQKLRAIVRPWITTGAMGRAPFFLNRARSRAAFRRRTATGT